MKSFFLILTSALLFSSVSYSADVVCSCEGDNCKDVEINFVPSNPGVYLNVKYNDGNKMLEGFATITSNKARTEVVYKLNNFILVLKDGEYSIPASDRICK